LNPALSAAAYCDPGVNQREVQNRVLDMGRE